MRNIGRVAYTLRAIGIGAFMGYVVGYFLPLLLARGRGPLAPGRGQVEEVAFAFVTIPLGSDFGTLIGVSYAWRRGWGNFQS